ncbi:hypothetical protein [endosymbiont of Ridgeia piscesae]|nr:hypothetical protein [endosymbiont of Ridgeia piscesae]
MIMWRFAFLSLALLLVGCATGSVLVTGTQRPPIDPSQVRIYRIPPNAEFEHIGIVKAQAEEVITQQEAMDRAVHELKKQAAKIGANGVILGGTGEKYESYSGFTPNAGGGGYFYSGTTEYQALQGDAIYVY